MTFKPDPEIFKGTEFSFEILTQRLRELSYLNSGLAITIRDERTDKSHEFKFEGGIASVRRRSELVEGADPRQADPLSWARSDGTQVEIAMQWNDSYSGVDLLLHEQHQEQRRRHAPHRLPRRR